MSEFMDPILAGQYLIQAYADLQKYYKLNEGLQKAIVTAIAAMTNGDYDPDQLNVKDLL